MTNLMKNRYVITMPLMGMPVSPHSCCLAFGTKPVLCRNLDTSMLLHLRCTLR
jgi:hypothetical protein